MNLILAHPEVAFRDCSDCKAWIYDEQTGKRAERRGKPIPRPKKPGPPCVAYKCPKGSPEGGVELSPQNIQAYRHYLECRAVGSFPDDPIVRRNAGIIRRIEDTHAQARQTKMFGALVTRSRLGGLG